MSKKDENKEVNTSKEKNKKKIILVVVGVILLAIILFLLWFFNRKFDVTFDLNNGSKNEIVQVKYNKVLNEKDIKTKEDLGDLFIDWYEVVDIKDNKDVLADESFDFKTKIKKDTKLKAVYKGAVETITITFDSRGGSKVDSITINKGTELNLPSNPTYKGYKFVAWETANGTPVYDKALLSESITLYAKWEKIEEKKEETPKKEEPKQEVKEEKISLSINKKAIHRRGTIKEAKVTANVQNSSNSKVAYSLSSTACAKINSSTGVITAKAESEIVGSDIQICEAGETVTVTGKLPSGKSASVKLNIEKDLYAHFTGSENNNSFVGLATSKTFYHAGEKEFSITANQSVTWNASCEDDVTYYGAACKYIGKTSSTAKIFKGTLSATYTKSDGSTSNSYSNSKVTLSTPAGQSLTLILRQRVN
ncbi:MAG: InlB B-repeat-containing protein [bacterium]|nr:InlB B-repeat-containing protein [bacterium]